MCVLVERRFRGWDVYQGPNDRGSEENPKISEMGSEMGKKEKKMDGKERRKERGKLTTFLVFLCVS